MSTDYSHLYAGIRALADESAEVRIDRIRLDRWITYGRAEAALTAMKDLLTHPKRTRMSNLLLVGPTNKGKSMISSGAIIRRSPPTQQTTASLTSRCSRCRCPPVPTRRDSSARS